MLFRLLRPAVFALGSETGHRLAIEGLRTLPDEIIARIERDHGAVMRKYGYL